MKKFYKIILLFVLLFGADRVFAQINPQNFQTLKQQSIEMYKKGEFRDALNSLQRLGKAKEAQTDAEFWNYLGLAYLERDNSQDALKSLEKAAKIAPQSAVYRVNLAFAYLLERKINKAQSEIEKVIAIDPNSANAYYIRGMSNLWENKSQIALTDAEKAVSVNGKFSPAYILKADIFIYEFGNGWSKKAPFKENVQWLAKAQEALEICEKDCERDQNYKDAQSKLDSVRAFYNHFKKKTDYEDGVTNEESKAPNRKPLKIIAKPRTRYTDSARSKNISGTITLGVVFSADKKISQVLVLSGLGYGLDEEALNSARNIVFEPETENGKPVTVVKTVQYSFTIY